MSLIVICGYVQWPIGLTAGANLVKLQISSVQYAIVLYCLQLNQVCLAYDSLLLDPSLFPWAHVKCFRIVNFSLISGHFMSC